MSYNAFARFYDRLTKNVNYPAYADRIGRILSDLSVKRGLLLDVACGTGNLCIELLRRGYGVFGADLSRDMLDIAASKACSDEFSCSSFRLFCCDMTKLDGILGGFNIPAAICSLDSLNHLSGREEIARAFVSVKKCLKKGGVFIFDMNTPYKHRQILGDNTFVYDLPEVYTVWQNRFREEDCSVGITLDFFEKTESGYQRYTEKFRERAYKTDTVLRLLKSCGFEAVGVYDGMKTCAPMPHCERILYVARSI